MGGGNNRYIAVMQCIQHECVANPCRVKESATNGEKTHRGHSNSGKGGYMILVDTLPGAVSWPVPSTATMCCNPPVSRII